MSTIIEQTPGGLYKQPARTVATFPSGLVRIDQSYKCSNAAESTHRDTVAVGNELPDDDGYPAIDGAFIFPHCQQVRDGAGFTEFVASAYGRTTDLPSNFITTIQTVQSGQESSYKLMNFTVDIVLLTSEILTLEKLSLEPALLDPFDFFYVNEYNSVKNITVTGTSNLSLTAVNAQGQIDDSSYRRRREFLITFDMFTVDGDPTGTTQDAVFTLNDPTIKIASQTHYGKFTEYKIDVNHNVTTGPTVGEAGSLTGP